jgi:hypothetical protein
VRRRSPVVAAGTTFLASVAVARQHLNCSRHQRWLPATAAAFSCCHQPGTDAAAHAWEQGGRSAPCSKSLRFVTTAAVIAAVVTSSDFDAPCSDSFRSEAARTSCGSCVCGKMPSPPSMQRRNSIFRPQPLRALHTSSFHPDARKPRAGTRAGAFAINALCRIAPPTKSSSTIHT